MKKYQILLAALTLSLSACRKQLEEVTPQLSLGQDLALTDPAAALTVYTGVYASFRNYHATFFQLGEMRSDLWADGLFTESEDGGLRMLWSQNISVTNVPAENWAGFYSLIARINNVITLIPKTTIEDARKQSILAEMHGLRAYVYYTMLRTWGGVPLVTEPIETVDNLTSLYRERATPAAIMTQIKADLEQSLTGFGTTNAFAPKRVYWNRAASLTLKGDVYLWSGTHMGGGTADFTTARTALEEVKAYPTLGLQASYADIFDPSKETNNREVIFAISYEKNEAQNTVYSSFQVNTTQAGTLVLDPVPGPPVPVNAVYPFVAGASRVGFSPAMLTRLSDPADTRIRASFRTMHRTSAGYPVAAIMLTKFIGRVDAGVQLYDNDFPIYRYADVLLLLAEAKTKLGTDPATEINAIRQRAYGTAYKAFTNGSQDENLNAILEEYLREFIGEGKRWWALRRAGDAYVFAAISPRYLPSAQAYKLLLPITIRMLNSDPKLTQTPGY